MTGEASNPGELRSGPESPPSEDIPPELFARFPGYQLLRRIGEGGMGTVYLARQTALDRLVALKVIRPTLAANPDFAERFSREARALARLNHPQIVTIHDFGQADGWCYLIMEYVDGTSLRDLLHQRRLSPEQSLDIIPRLCEALQYAHDEGVVHRDIKPENILIDRKGRVKIADFGLAKLATAENSPRSLTATQQVVGTPQYMAPEQLQGARRVDHRADIYALGVVFYEMLTGELPLGRFEPPSQQGGIDPRLDEVVMRSLERDPERRYQRASQLRDELESIVRGPVESRAAPLAGDTSTRSPSAPQSPAWSSAGRKTSSSTENELRKKDLFASGAALCFLGFLQVGLSLMFASPFFSQVLREGPGRITILGGIGMLLMALTQLALGVAQMTLGGLTLARGSARTARAGGYLLLFPCTPLVIINMLIGAIIVRLMNGREDVATPSIRPLSRSSPEYVSTMTLPTPPRRRRSAAIFVVLALAVVVILTIWHYFANRQLLAAVQRSDGNSVSLWYRLGASLEVHDESGRSALFLAALSGNADIVDHLLGAGAAVDAPTPGGDTPLMVASYEGHDDVCARLLRARAQVNLRNSDGATPLILAIQGGHASVMDSLIDAGASTTTADNQHLTPLHWAALHGRTAMVAKLLAKGVDVDAIADDQDTPLLKAAWKGHTPVVEALLAAGATVDRPNQHGETPLILAAAFGHVDTARALIKKGADERRRSSSGVSPLMIAALRGHLPVVDLLLTESPPKPDSKEAQESLSSAVSSGHDAVIERLLAAGIPESDVACFRRGYQLAHRGDYFNALRLLEKARELIHEDAGEWRFGLGDWNYAVSRPKLNIGLFVGECQRLTRNAEAAQREFAACATANPSAPLIPVLRKWQQSETQSHHRAYSLQRRDLESQIPAVDGEWPVSLQYQDVERGIRSVGSSGSQSTRLPNLFP